MADFAVHSVAVEQAPGWPAGSFLDACTGNRASAREANLEDSPIAPLSRRCAEEAGFVGRVGELLAWLDLRAAGWAEVELSRSKTGCQVVIRKGRGIHRHYRHLRRLRVRVWLWR
jgi:hypothetical protein